MSTLLWNILLDSLLRELKNNGVDCTGYADDCLVRVCGKFLDTILDRREWENYCSGNLSEETIVCFTDGSLKERQAGAEALIERIGYEVSAPLGRQVTVFRAKVYAIIMVADELKRVRALNEDIVIFSDSQAAIKSLESTKINS